VPTFDTRSLQNQPVTSAQTPELRKSGYQTREEARADIIEYITMFYNSRRLHSYLGYQSPDEHERNGRLADAA